METTVHYFDIFIDDTLYATGCTLSDTMTLVQSMAGVTAQLDVTR